DRPRMATLSPLWTVRSTPFRMSRGLPWPLRVLVTPSSRISGTAGAVTVLTGSLRCAPPCDRFPRSARSSVRGAPLRSPRSFAHREAGPAIALLRRCRREVRAGHRDRLVLLETGLDLDDLTVGH